MCTKVVPFPLSRRRALVCKQAWILSGLAPKSAQRHLAHQLKVQHDALMRRGVDPDRIERELASLERTILALSEQEFVA